MEIKTEECSIVLEKPVDKSTADFKYILFRIGSSKMSAVMKREEIPQYIKR